jgi:D,D-heptose 1,7-bisphosphate phosphatase
MKKALFLDRDGVINLDKEYVYRFDDIEWMPGVFELIKYFNQIGYLVIILTNQSGVEHGFYQESDVLKLHQQMDEYLKKQNCYIDDWFFCPSLKGEDRKPAPGMMVKAAHKYSIDLSGSLMIGDKVSDILNIEGPSFFILKGKYDLKNLPIDIKIFENHPDLLKELKTRFL